MGSLLLMGSTANIDTGKQNMKWHQACASSFFVTTLLAQLLNTLLFAKLSFGFNAVNRNLVYLKIVNFVLIIIQIYITSTYGTFLESETGEQVESTIANFIEWSLTYTILFGYILMSLDVANFKYVY
jgi:hypothetical protein